MGGRHTAVGRDRPGDDEEGAGEEQAQADELQGGARLIVVRGQAEGTGRV